MKRKKISLIVATAVGTLLITACEKKPEQRSPAPVTQTGPATAPVVAPNTPQVALGTPTAAEAKEGASPVQGQVDPKEPPQRRDFEPKK